MGKSKYDENTFPLLAEKYARQGLTDIQIAERLGISEASYYNYQNDHLEFLEAIKRGKAPVDVQVENALLKRALGYEYKETKSELKNDCGKITETNSTTNKQMAPDVGAIAFWLKNRLPKEWRDVKDHNIVVEEKEEFSHYTDDELRDIAEIHRQARDRGK